MFLRFKLVGVVPVDERLFSRVSLKQVGCQTFARTHNGHIVRVFSVNEKVVHLAISWGVYTPCT